MSTGKWQKEIPDKNGRYWVATRDGLSAGLATVARHNGKILIAGHTPEIEWGGWWWSEPVIEPKAPPADIWDRARTFAWGRYNRNIGEYLPEPSDLRGVMDAAAFCQTCLGSVFCDSHRAMYDRVAAKVKLQPR